MNLLIEFVLNGKNLLTQENLKILISNVGEPLIRDKLMVLYNNWTANLPVNERINLLKKRIGTIRSRSWAKQRDQNG